MFTAIVTNLHTDGGLCMWNSETLKELLIVVTTMVESRGWTDFKVIIRQNIWS